MENGHLKPEGEHDGILFAIPAKSFLVLKSSFKEGLVDSPCNRCTLTGLDVKVPAP